MRSEGKEVATHLDMGCGLGSVLMMVGWRYPELRSTGIEAQQISFELASRSVEFNGASGRMKVYHGDLRDQNVLPPNSTFDIVTGTPPYFKSGEGKPPLFVIAVIEEGEWKDYEKKTMTIRNREGKYTKEYHGLLRDMGFPPQREAEDYDSII